MSERRPWPGRENLPPEVKHMAEATHRALDLPGGEAILNQMLSKEISIPDGLAKLAVLSGEYEAMPDEAAIRAAGFTKFSRNGVFRGWRRDNRFYTDREVADAVAQEPDRPGYPDTEGRDGPGQ